MKLIHTADLHIGKSVCEHSMLDEQRHILAEILKAVETEKPEALLVAGDVYDKSVPSADAVAVLDDFLVKLSKTGTKVFVLSGNHDSAERLAFGSRLMNDRGVYMSQVYSGSFAPVTLKDGSTLFVYYEETDGSNIRARKFRVTDGKIEWLKF